MKYYKACREFILRNIGDMNILVPVGEKASKFANLCMLNETSLLMWNKMSSHECTVEEITDAILNEYAVDAQTARENIVSALNAFIKIGAVEIVEK